MLSIDSIITAGQATAYRISNSDRKCWLLPEKGITTGLELYQPSGIKGRLLKLLFPWLHWLRPIRKLIHASTERIGLRPEILLSAEKAFGINDLSYSIFGGTPSVHQKITIQFFKGKRILGYCKLTDSPEIEKLFIHEQHLLTQLLDAGITDIPECLHCGKLSDGTAIFIQSTVKTPRSFSPTHWTNLHEDFLTNLSTATSVSIPFEKSDYAKALFSLKNSIGKIPEEFRPLIGSRLDMEITAHQGKRETYSAFHADFTPWNMIVESGRLFVFDWEYSRLTYPSGLDRYHFFIQQALHVAFLPPKEIYDKISQYRWFDPHLLRAYLLDIIARFTIREPSDLPPSTVSMVKSWTELLKLSEGRQNTDGFSPNNKLR